jgi:YD repeat-containing protein
MAVLRNTATIPRSAWWRRVETGYPAPTRLVYDSFDNLMTLTRPNGAVTRYEYDRINRVTKVTYPGGDEETLVYDARGRVSQWRAGSRLVTYEYDSVDRLVHMSCPSTGDDYHYNYDAANRLLSMQMSSLCGQS